MSFESIVQEMYVHFENDRHVKICSNIDFIIKPDCKQIKVKVELHDKYLKYEKACKRLVQLASQKRFQYFEVIII